MFFHQCLNNCEFSFIRVPSRLTGKAQSIKGNSPAAKELKEYIKKHPNGNRVGEVAIGTNQSIKHLIGEMLQDEKFPGFHLAFGDPYASRTNADYSCPQHVDIVIKNVNLWLDKKQILKEGKFIL